MELSIIIPAYNEEENVIPTYEGIVKALSVLKGYNYEIIFVDDGSDDRTFDAISSIGDKCVSVIRLKKNLGKSYALFEGIKKSRGNKILTTDADLQIDANDIPLMSNKIDEGYDAVFGVRYDRNDSLSKKIQSKIANTVANVVFHERFRDRGCPLKCFRKEALKGLDYFDGIHRFFPTLLRNNNKICELEVKHLPRVHGSSKYGSVKRAVKALKDTLYVRKLLSAGDNSEDKNDKN